MRNNQYSTGNRFVNLKSLVSPGSLLLSICLLCLASVANGQQFRNLSIPVTSPQIVYTPFVCNATTVKVNPQSCAGAWQLSADNATISTTGPSSISNNIIPQLFFQFRAFNLFLSTSSTSNATVNVTASSNGMALSTLFNTTLRSATIINLQLEEVSLLTITFVPSSTPTRLDLEAITITTVDNATITSILPSQTLPPSISLPVFSTSTSTSVAPSASAPTTTPLPIKSSKRKQIAEAVGLTLGISLGLTAIAAAAFYFWKRRRQRRRRRSLQARHETQPDWRNTQPSRYP
ncbi:hypothetical protein BJ912DRAFT_439058 [Pholiota molesta]|nr:hypothetical protein BJ912DRAFT_439058 [Pholiota molesta]